jgi:hypothetical protein
MIESLEELTTARAVHSHLAVVELDDELGDSFVELVEREESLVAKAREDPSLRDAHARLHPRLVARVRRSRRQDHRPVVRRHLGIRALDARLVAARHCHPALELIGHHRASDAAHVLEGAHVAADPVADSLPARRLRVRVVGRAEYRDEELDLDHLSRLAIDDDRLLARVVHEELRARVMHLPHRRTARRQPPAVVHRTPCNGSRWGCSPNTPNAAAAT